MVLLWCAFPIVRYNMSPMLRIFAAALAGLLLATPTLAAPAGKSPSTQATPVVTAPAVRKPMPLMLSSIGTVQPPNIVSIRPRIEGEIVRMAFEEGQEVREGEVLFELDARTVQVQLRQAEAALARDEAQLKRAQADAKRYAELLKSGSTPPQKAEEAIAAAAVLEASIKADEAAIAQARLNLSYATIGAPISGRTGAVPAKVGNLVRPTDQTPLVTITQVRPITVSFSLPEKHLPLLRRAAAGSAPVPVRAALPQTAEKPVDGSLSFIDSAVDPATGTILLKASFANEDGRLWPGSFVSVEIQAAIDPEAVVVPAHAVQSSQAGAFVYVVTPEQTADMRLVKVARVHNGEAIIGEGLKGGEQVVIDGQFRLFSGAPVRDRTPAEQSEKRT